jgi:NAD(P)-dependent dehydrogenase (short-subunit alcohol dehydrogenase family)
MKKHDAKIAVITGGNSSIGLATAQRFVDEGAYVYITGRRRTVQTEYSLTDKGMALEPLLVVIAAFSTRYERVFKDGRPRMSIKQIFRTDRLSEIYDY